MHMQMIGSGDNINLYDINIDDDLGILVGGVMILCEMTSYNALDRELR